MFILASTDYSKFLTSNLSYSNFLFVADKLEQVFHIDNEGLPQCTSF